MIYLALLFLPKGAMLSLAFCLYVLLKHLSEARVDCSELNTLKTLSYFHSYDSLSKCCKLKLLLGTVSIQNYLHCS